MSNSSNSKGLDKSKINTTKAIKNSLVDSGYEPKLARNDTKTEFLTFNDREQTLVGIPNFEPITRRCYYDLDLSRIRTYLMRIVRQSVTRGFVQGDISDIEYFFLEGKAKFAKHILLQALAYLIYRVYLTIPSSAQEFGKFAKNAFADPPIILREFSMSISLIGNFIKDGAEYELRYPIGTLWGLINLFNDLFNLEVHNRRDDEHQDYMHELFDHEAWNRATNTRCVDDMNYTAEITKEAEQIVKEIGTFDVSMRMHGDPEDRPTVFSVAFPGTDLPFILQQAQFVRGHIMPEDEARVQPLIQKLVRFVQASQFANQPRNPNQVIRVGEFTFVPSGFTNRQFLRNYVEFVNLNRDFTDKVKKLRFCEPCTDRNGDEAIIYSHKTVESIDDHNDPVFIHTISNNGLMSFANTGYALLYGFCKPVRVNEGYKCIIHLDEYVIDNVVSRRFDRLSVV